MRISSIGLVALLLAACGGSSVDFSKYTVVMNHLAATGGQDQKILRLSTAIIPESERLAAATVLAHGNELAISQDRTRLAYVGTGTGPDGCAGLCVMDTHGGGVQEALPESTTGVGAGVAGFSVYHNPVISNRGDLAFIHGQNAVDQELRILPQGAAAAISSVAVDANLLNGAPLLQFTTDGETVVLLYDGELHLFHTATGVTRAVETATDEKHKITFAQVHPVRNTIIYTTSEDVCVLCGNTAVHIFSPLLIFEYDIDSGTTKQLNRIDGLHEFDARNQVMNWRMLQLAPDGNSALMVADKNTGSVSQYQDPGYTIPFLTTISLKENAGIRYDDAWTDVYHDLHAFDWSPDGNAFVCAEGYHSYIGPTFEINSRGDADVFFPAATAIYFVD